MEADWSVEIGPGLPEITVPWSAEGLTWVDLSKVGPKLDSALQSIPAAAAEPALAHALRRLNATDSRWFTSKCDLWTSPPDDTEPLDPCEFDATDLAPAPLHLCASYLDILPRDESLFASFRAQETFLRTLVALLRSHPQPHGRIDFILRAARIDSSSGFAFTAYASGCGATPETAHQVWQQVLARLTTALRAP